MKTILSLLLLTAVAHADPSTVRVELENKATKQHVEQLISIGTDHGGEITEHGWFKAPNRLKVRLIDQLLAFEVQRTDAQGASYEVAGAVTVQPGKRVLAARVPRTDGVVDVWFTLEK